MKPYIFIIPNKKIKIYFLFAIGIILLNVLGFTAYAATNTNRVSNSWIMLMIILGAIAGAFYLLSPKKRLEFAGTMILLSGIFWISRGFNELFFANLILWLLYSISRRRLLVLVDAEQIIYPSFPKKEFPGMT
ncbi:hypothetical protein [Niabella ginsengisoli]|uniref:Uncharacterized protein n=1 Tax=Niabella ginsengisoli TaxID=522298 RepID=A0ABS9SHM6_9BACT|nr:hypothetical protein [Niabella ginsengisoli]MCH5597877.1 hypothetical protein [Niabella ginsengisoli]